MTAHIDPLIAARQGGAPLPQRPSAPASSPAFEVETAPRAVAPSNATRVEVIEGIEAAYADMYPGLVRLAFLLVDTQELAEEAVQEAFARAYPRWGTIENPAGYMRTSVINACRKVQRRRRLAGRTPQPPHEHADLGADHVADAVRRLRSPAREAVVLRYYLQLSDAEIATTLKIAPGTVKSTLHRARQLLKKELS